MSKTKTLFTMALLVLLGSMGAAQAQNLPLRSQAIHHTEPPPPGREAKLRCPAASCSTLPRIPQALSSRSLSITPSLSQST